MTYLWGESCDTSITYSWVNVPYKLINLHFPGVEIPFISPDIISPYFPRLLPTKKTYQRRQDTAAHWNVPPDDAPPPPSCGWLWRRTTKKPSLPQEMIGFAIPFVCLFVWNDETGILGMLVVSIKFAVSISGDQSAK